VLELFLAAPLCAWCGTRRSNHAAIALAISVRAVLRLFGKAVFSILHTLHIFLLSSGHTTRSLSFELQFSSKALLPVSLNRGWTEEG
jgi:hypothetical protein